jgi:hypothetical protein
MDSRKRLEPQLHFSARRPCDPAATMTRVTASSRAAVLTSKWPAGSSRIRRVKSPSSEELSACTDGYPRLQVSGMCAGQSAGLECGIRRHLLHHRAKSSPNGSSATDEPSSQEIRAGGGGYGGRRTDTPTRSPRFRHALLGRNRCARPIGADKPTSRCRRLRPARRSLPSARSPTNATAQPPHQRRRALNPFSRRHRRRHTGCRQVIPQVRASVVGLTGPFRCCRPRQPADAGHETTRLPYPHFLGRASHGSE